MLCKFALVFSIVLAVLLQLTRKNSLSQYSSTFPDDCNYSYLHHELRKISTVKPETHYIKRLKVDLTHTVSQKLNSVSYHNTTDVVLYENIGDVAFNYNVTMKTKWNDRRPETLKLDWFLSSRYQKSFLQIHLDAKPVQQNHTNQDSC